MSEIETRNHVCSNNENKNTTIQKKSKQRAFRIMHEVACVELNNTYFCLVSDLTRVFGIKEQDFDTQLLKLSNSSCQEFGIDPEKRTVSVIEMKSLIEPLTIYMHKVLKDGFTSSRAFLLTAFLFECEHLLKRNFNAYYIDTNMLCRMFSRTCYLLHMLNALVVYRSVKRHQFNSEEALELRDASHHLSSAVVEAAYVLGDGAMSKEDIEDSFSTGEHGMFGEFLYQNLGNLLPFGKAEHFTQTVQLESLYSVQYAETLYSLFSSKVREDLPKRIAPCDPGAGKGVAGHFDVGDKTYMVSVCTMHTDTCPHLHVSIDCEEGYNLMWRVSLLDGKPLLGEERIPVDVQLALHNFMYRTDVYGYKGRQKILTGYERCLDLLKSVDSSVVVDESKRPVFYDSYAVLKD